jgi:hypothetical protein
VRRSRASARARAHAHAHARSSCGEAFVPAGSLCPPRLNLCSPSAAFVCAAPPSGGVIVTVEGPRHKDPPQVPKISAGRKRWGRGAEIGHGGGGGAAALAGRSSLGPRAVEFPPHPGDFFHPVPPAPLRILGGLPCLAQGGTWWVAVHICHMSACVNESDCKRDTVIQSDQGSPTEEVTLW